MAKVSVIMPCFNQARYLPESVNSVLGQEDADVELLITDDCSTDNTWEVMSRLAGRDSRIKLIRHERNRGLPRSRNDGMRLAQGEFIAFCDSDDVWEPRKIKTQVELLQNNADFDIAYCETVIIDERSSLTGKRFSDFYPLPKVTSGWLFEELATRNFINVQSAMIRRRCFETVDHFDEDLRVLEDWWYWVQLARNHRFLYWAGPLARYRMHGQSMTATKQRSFPMTRAKIFSRMLRKCHELSPRARAEIYYVMGVDLCGLGKRRLGRRMFWKAIRFSAGDVTRFGRLLKSIVRLAYN